MIGSQCRRRPQRVRRRDRRRRHRRPGGGLRAVAPRHLVRRPRARAARRRRHLQRGDRRLHDRRRSRRAADSEARGDRAVPGARPRRSARLDQAAAPRLHPARRTAARAAGGVGARHPDARRPVRPHDAVFVAGQAADGRGAVRRRRGATTADESIGAFMTRRFGDEATTYLAEPLLAGIHAGDVDRLSVRALFPRLVDAERKHGSLLRAFRPASPQSAISNPQCRRRVQVAARRLERDGARAGRARSATQHVRLNTGVDAITGRGPFAVRTSAARRSRRRAVVVATPAYVDRAAAARSRRRSWRGSRGEIPYASAATVALAFNARDVAPSADRLRVRRARASRTPASSRRRGCRRSGRIARPRIAC